MIVGRDSRCDPYWASGGGVELLPVLGTALQAGYAIAGQRRDGATLTNTQRLILGLAVVAETTVLAAPAVTSVTGTGTSAAAAMGDDIARVAGRQAPRGPAARLPQDVAVNPTAPRALPWNRPVSGSTTQNAFVQARIRELRALDAVDIRVNQQQVDINGVRVGINRPDLQYTLNSQRFYEEFDRLSSLRGYGHAERVFANDPSGIIRLFSVD